MSIKKYFFLFIITIYTAISFAQNFEPFTCKNPTYGAHAINCTRWIISQKNIAIGDAGSILLSNDDGLTWQRIEPFSKQTFRSVFIKDSLTFSAIASHDNGLGDLYKTLDGGLTWI